MKKCKKHLSTIVVGGAVGFVALGYLVLLFLILFATAAVFNFFPATVAFLIVTKALGFGFTYWQVYWVTYLIVFVFGLRFKVK